MGEVVEIGSEVKKLKVGDRVVVPFTISCGACWFCERSLFSLCDISWDPGVANVVEVTGGNGPANGPTNTALIYIALKPLAERKVSAANIINRLRPKLNRLPVASVFLQPAQDILIGGRSTDALYQYTLQSDHAKELAPWGPILLNAMRRLPGLQDVNSD